MKKIELQERCAVMFPQYPDIVNVSQLQKMLGISRHLAYDLIREGYLAGFRIGNSYRVPMVSVFRHIMELEVEFRGC